MTVYADIVFLLNFCVDLLLLWLTMAVRRQRTSIWRLIVAAAFGATYAMFILVPSWSLLLTWGIKVVFSILIVLIAFGYRNHMAFLRNWGVFYFVSFVVGGGMFAAHYFLQDQQEVLNGILLTHAGSGAPSVTWMFLAVAFPLVWWYSRFTFRSLAERHTVHQFLIRVDIVIQGQTVSAAGLVDTGNQLRDPMSRAPVMMAEAKLVQSLLPEEVVGILRERDVAQSLTRLPPEWITKMKLIPYRSVTRGTDFLIAVKPDKVRLVYEGRVLEERQVLIGLDDHTLSTDGTYQVIVHPSLMEEAS